MANLQFFMENFDKFLEDTKIQVESLGNDLKDLPESLQQTARGVEEQVASITERIPAASRELLSGALLKRDLRPELSQAVSHLEMEVDELFTRIKSAIEKAK